RADFEAAVAAHGRFNTHKALEPALAKRIEFTLADDSGVVAESEQPFGARHPALAAHVHPVDALATPAARTRWLAWAQALGTEKAKTPQQAASAIELAFAQDDLAERFKQLREALFVAKEDRLKTHLAKF